MHGTYVINNYSIKIYRIRTIHGLHHTSGLYFLNLSSRLLITWKGGHWTTRVRVWSSISSAVLVKCLLSASIYNGFLRRHYIFITLQHVWLILIWKNIYLSPVSTVMRETSKHVPVAFACFLVNSPVAVACITFLQVTNLVVEFGEI